MGRERLSTPTKNDSRWRWSGGCGGVLYGTSSQAARALHVARFSRSTKARAANDGRALGLWILQLASTSATFAGSAVCTLAVMCSLGNQEVRLAGVVGQLGTGAVRVDRVDGLLQLAKRRVVVVAVPDHQSATPSC
jgi:hypothetical protein